MLDVFFYFYAKHQTIIAENRLPSYGLRTNVAISASKIEHINEREILKFIMLHLWRVTFSKGDFH